MADGGRCRDAAHMAPTRARAPRRRNRVVMVLVVAVAAAVVGVCVGPLPGATAHPELLASDPDNLAVVAVPPKSIRLTYFDTVEPQVATVTLSVDGSAARELRSRIRGSEVVATVGSVPPGTNQQWVVNHRVTASDGHHVADALSFVVAPDPDAPAAPIPVGSAASAFDRPPAQDSTEGRSAGRDASRPGVLSLLWLPVAVVLVGLIGPAAVSARNRRRDRRHVQVPDGGRGPDSS